MIIITGGAGFIGSALLWKMNELGRKDILLVDQEVKGSTKWPNVQKHSFETCLESGDFIARLEKGEFNGRVDAGFHMGACSSTTEMDTAYLRKNNSLYSERIARWCIDQKVYLSYASSAATYGAGEQGFSDEDALTQRLKPLNPYGQSKLDFDVWVLKNGLEKKTTGFRFFNVYGPNEYHKGSMRSMVHKGFEQIQSTGKIKLFRSYKKEYSDGGQMRDFVYVKDVIDAMIWFWHHPEKKGIYNLGSGKAQSWNELAEAIFQACGKKRNIEYIEMPDSIKNQYQYFTEADLKKFHAAGCPTVFLNLAHGTADYVHNYLSKKDSYL